MSDPSQYFEPSNALLAAVKPIYAVALGAVVSAWAVIGFVNEVRAIKQEVGVVKILVCRDYPQDSLCDNARRPK